MSEWKGQRWVPDDLGKFKDANVPKFDFHPDFRKENNVFTPVVGQRFVNLNKWDNFLSVHFGRYTFSTTLLYLGDKGLLTGKAEEEYQKLVKQLERPMITKFQKGDIFFSDDDRFAVSVIDQIGSDVVYYKYGPNPNGKYWEAPVSGNKIMPVHKFAMNVLKISPRYNNLLSLKLLVPK